MVRILLVLVLGSPLLAGDKLVEIKVDSGLALSELLDQLQAATGKPILYDPNNQRIRGQKIATGFMHRVPRARVFDTFRSILSFYELMLVPVGPEAYELYLVIDSRSTNNFVKAKAVHVEFDDLEKFADKDSLYIRCAIPVRHIENLTTLRTALSTSVSPAGVGRVHEVPGSRHIIVQDFAPAVASIAKIVTQMDRPRPDRAMKLELIRLEHAFAPDVAELVGELMERSAPAPARGRRTPAAAPPPSPRVLPYERLNALAVAATDADLEAIRGLVAVLDQRGEKEVRVMRLEHARADRVVKSLEGVDARLAVHPRTNALIVAAEPAVVDTVVKLVHLLDRPTI